MLAWSITVSMGAAGRSTTSTAGSGSALSGVTIRAWLPCRLMFTITTGPPAGGRSQVGERDRAQEVLEALDPADLVHGGVPVPGGLPPLFQHLLLGGVHLIDVADRIRATDVTGGGAVQDRAGCLQHRGQIREPVPAARPGPGAGAGPASTTSTGLPPAVPPPGRVTCGDRRRCRVGRQPGPFPQVMLPSRLVQPMPGHQRQQLDRRRVPLYRALGIPGQQRALAPSPCRCHAPPRRRSHHPRTLPEHLEGLVQVRLLPGAPEPGPQRDPEVGQHPGRSGWSAGVASTASWRAVMAWSRSASCPVRSNRVCSAMPEVGQVSGPVGVVGRGGVDGLREPGDGLVQVRLLPGAPEPGPQRGPEVGQPLGAVGVVGRGGVDGLPADGDGLVQVRLLPGALEPGLQRDPEVGEYLGRSGWSAGGGVGGLGEPGDGLVQVRLLPGALEPGLQRVPEVGQHRRPVGVAGRGGVDGLASLAMAWSRSACCPVRPNRVCSAAPRLDRYMGRSGWSAGVASTASVSRGDGLVQVRQLPGALEPGLQRVSRGWTGSRAGRGGRPGWRRRPR